MLRLLGKVHGMAATVVVKGLVVVKLGLVSDADVWDISSVFAISPYNHRQLVGSLFSRFVIGVESLVICAGIAVLLFPTGELDMVRSFALNVTHPGTLAGIVTGLFGLMPKIFGGGRGIGDHQEMRGRLDK